MGESHGSGFARHGRGVTAASGGLGRAIAEEFAAEGAVIVIAARNEARLAAAAEEIAAGTRGTVFAQRAGCTVEADIVALVRDTVQRQRSGCILFMAGAHGHQPGPIR